MTLNPPTFIEHNNDSDVKGISLRCSPFASSDQQINVSIKKWNIFYGKIPGH